MGSNCSDLYNMWFSRYEKRCLMIGLNSAGKKTLIFWLSLGKLVPPIPPFGIRLDATYKGIKIDVCDVCGQSDRVRALWLHYYAKTQGLIFVVDASDIDRIDEARIELHRLLKEDELRDAILLIFANKQDLPNALKPMEIINCLRLNTINHREWKVQSACFLTNDGVYEGLDWLGEKIDKKFNSSY